MRRDQRGTAVVGTMIGFLIFMLLLLVAVQVLVRLYATSEVTAAAFDAADRVATSPTGAAAIPAAQAAALTELGSWGRAHTTFTWIEADGTQVVVSVRAEAPGFVDLPIDRSIARTVTVRTERFR